jgi:hypothetical protein
VEATHPAARLRLRRAGFLLAAALTATVAAATLDPPTARAGTICGTVADASTHAPISDAGIFVRKETGEDTGLHGATEPSGTFCIYFVPPGTYTLEIRVDDYAVAYVNGVTVTGAITAVPVLIADAGLALARPWPSPASASLHIAWTMPSEGPARLAVFDVRGHLLIAWSAPAFPRGVRAFDWDLRDAHGARLPAGVYYLRLESERARRVRRFVCLP